MTRSYGQLCPLARALDRVGDRWTLLVVRDLAAGPRRYSDLLGGLPGIGTTLLADRLRRLEDDGLVAKTELPPPAASTVYELTPAGLELANALVPLAAWGLQFLGEIRDEEIRPEWVLMFMQRNFDGAAARGVHDVYEFHVGAQTFHVIVSDGVMTSWLGTPRRSPDVVVTATWKAFMTLGLGSANPEDLASAGELAVEGDPAAAARCYRLLVDEHHRWAPLPPGKK